MLRRRNRASVWETIYNRKPSSRDKINWRNPISRSLVGFYLYNDSVGVMRNLAANNGPAPNQTAFLGGGTLEGATARDPGLGPHAGARYGPRVLWTGTGRVSIANPTNLSTLPFTVATLLQPNFTTADASFRGIFYYGSGGAGDEARIWLRRQASSGVFFVDSPGNALGQATFSWAQNDVFWATYSNTGGGGSVAQWYQDHIALSMSNGGGTPATPGAWVVNVGDRSTTQPASWLGGIYCTAVWRRVVPAFEVAEFVKRPFEMIESDSTRETFMFLEPPPDLGEPVGILPNCGHPLFTKCGSWLTD